VGQGRGAQYALSISSDLSYAIRHVKPRILGDLRSRLSCVDRRADVAPGEPVSLGIIARVTIIRRCNPYTCQNCSY
jgi:hypothetical protein